MDWALEMIHIYAASATVNHTAINAIAVDYNKTKKQISFWVFTKLTSSPHSYTIHIF